MVQSSYRSKVTLAWARTPLHNSLLHSQRLPIALLSPYVLLSLRVPIMTFSLRILCCFLLIHLAHPHCPAADPTWWTASGTNIKEPGATAHDYSPANLGQLKHVASQANAYLDSVLATGGGSGTAVDARCEFLEDSNYSPINLGQLKHVAQSFYDRFAQIHYNWNSKTYGVATPLYPWSVTTGSANAAPATLGQLKQVFAFEISSDFLNKDSDGDGLKDWHEHGLGLNPNAADTDLDWVPDAAEVGEGTNALAPLPLLLSGGLSTNNAATASTPAAIMEYSTITVTGQQTCT